MTPVAAHADEGPLFPKKRPCAEIREFGKFPCPRRLTSDGLVRPRHDPTLAVTVTFADVLSNDCKASLERRAVPGACSADFSASVDLLDSSFGLSSRGHKARVGGSGDFGR